jgi:menaquinone-dependent protoporphyrinogen oxidase
MDVLVAYGTKRGSTRDIAEAVGEELRQAGMRVDVRAAGDVRDVARYGAVVLGGALYMSRWHRAARGFGRRFAPLLQERPVWLFSSGPLDATASEGEIPPVAAVAKLRDGIGARGHATFGGRLEADATGFPASAMAKTMAGDHRDFDRIRAWARRISEDLGATTAAA